MAFKVSSTDQDFNTRVDDLFSCLSSVETTLPEDGFVFESSTSGLFHRDKHGNLAPESQLFDGNFKRPNQSNIPQRKRLKVRCATQNKTPDYELHPENWTCYSMRETQALNEEQNKKACLQLLSELKQKKDSSNTEDKFDEMRDKIVFKKTTPKIVILSNPREPDGDRTSGVAADVGGTKKFVMEEHVVGVAKKKKKKTDKTQNSTVENKQDKVKLSYLKFDDEEDNEME